jgi:hypothetical protein
MVVAVQYSVVVGFCETGNEIPGAIKIRISSQYEPDAVEQFARLFSC